LSFITTISSKFITTKLSNMIWLKSATRNSRDARIKPPQNRDCSANITQNIGALKTASVLPTTAETLFAHLG
jgi:hypothetical protein